MLAEESRRRAAPGCEHAAAHAVHDIEFDGPSARDRKREIDARPAGRPAGAEGFRDIG